MRIIEKVVYKFEELGKGIQSKIIENWNNEESINLDFLVDNWKERIQEIGFNEVEIRYSLSYCQGDGASFKFDTTLLKSLDWNSIPELKKIINEFYIKINNLEFLNSENRKMLYSDLLGTDIKCHTIHQRYYHENSTSCDIIEFPDYDYYIYNNNFNLSELNLKKLEKCIINFNELLEIPITEFMQSTGNEIKKDGYKEIEYQNSAEYIKEIININDYEFFQDGTMF